MSFRGHAARMKIVLVLAVLTLAPVTSVRAATNSSPGVVWAWGANNGVVNGGPIRPIVMDTLNGVNAATGGNNFAIFLQGDGTVWGWGFNRDGELGDGGKTDRSTPV